jgi:hypothetical protein
MKVTLISSTNELFRPIEKLTMNITIGLTVIMDFKEYTNNELKYGFEKGVARTSHIKEIKYNEISRNCYDITVKTLNSTYVFRKGKLSNNPPLTKEEIEQIQMALLFN